MKKLTISIRTKLFCIILVVATISLLLSYGLSGWIQYRAYKEEMVEKLQINARLVGEYCVVPLTFQDKAGALDTLKKLKTISTTEAVHLYNTENKLFASYSWKKELPPPETVPALTNGTYKQGSLYVVLPINFQGDNYGTIAIQASDREFKEKTLAILVRLLPGMFILLILSALLALWLQKFMSTPILHLADIIKNVSGKTSNLVRLPEVRHDEIGVLYAAYNTMLDRLVQYDQRRNQAEQNLRSSEQRFRSLVESITECFWEVDSELCLIYASPIFEQITGYSPKRVEGHRLDKLIHSSSGKTTLKNFVASMQTKKPFRMVEDLLIQKQGKEIHIESSGTPILDTNNNLLGYRGILRDITEQVELGICLRQAQKMESIGTLAGGIAHDFNNLLYPIIGFAEMLKEDLPPDSPEHESAQEIYNAGKRSSELVKQILAFSRQTEHKLSPVRFQKILTEVYKLTRSTIPSDIEIHLDIKKDCGLIMAEATQLHQIAMNLITNAYHAVEKASGKISIQLKEIILDNDDLKNSLLQPGEYVMLSVSDNGVGIPKEIMNNIFEPYFTTKEKGKGTGLGLAVIYGILTEHKGYIKVYSEVGKGTTFNVYLPLMKKSIEDISTEKVLNKLTGTERILLVDDEESVVRLEKLMLERLGYNVSARSDSLEALETFNSNPDGYDLVISDMTMPNMTGNQLARELMSIRPNIPIIICTGFSERINKEQAEANKVKGFLMKPVVKSEMAQMVREVLDETKI